MRRIVVLSALTVVIAASLALAPSPSHSAQRGTAASTSQGKSTTAPAARSKSGLVKPGGKDGATKPGKGTTVARSKPKRPTGYGKYNCRWWCPPNKGPHYCRWYCPGDRIP
jgi:hypothetical protein